MIEYRPAQSASIRFQVAFIDVVPIHRKLAMTPILVFDIETIPDIASIRLLNELPDALSDHEVAEFAFQQRRAKTGSEFMPHHLQRIVAISCCLR